MKNEKNILIIGIIIFICVLAGGYLYLLNRNDSNTKHIDIASNNLPIETENIPTNFVG